MENLARFKGKVAIITASTQGIGFSIAERLASEGASVVISSRKAENVAEAVEKLRRKNCDVVGVVCHVSNREQRNNLFDTAVKKYGGLDILISNAAVNPAFGAMTTLKTNEEMWDKIFDVNVRAAWLLAKEGAPLLKKRKGSNMTFISSVVGFQVLKGAMVGAYAISKTALLGLTKSVAAELAPDVRVNCVAPGLIDTNFTKEIPLNAVREEFTKYSMLRRVGQPKEVASLVAFLSSDEASFITGENMVVGGGVITRL